MLEDVKTELYDVIKEDEENALTYFETKCKADPLLKKMNYMCDDVKSNLTRLIYMERIFYEDKLKFELKARLFELKLTENMNKFQEAIDTNADKYLELNKEDQECKFKEVWISCFGSDNEKEEEAELAEKFDHLYSVFRMESKTMETKQTISLLFHKFKFKMDDIIQALQEELPEKFCNEHRNIAAADQFIYPWKENRVSLKEMTPYIGKTKCEYLNKDSLFITEDKIKLFDKKRKVQLKFENWVPSECYPLVRYCSGYFNHPDIIWKLGKRKQILLLASKLKEPYNSERSTWHKFIEDISARIQNFTDGDPSISHSTVKEIVEFLCHICKIVNYEINFIEAKLTNAAERSISTYAFALALKPLLKTKIERQKENKIKEDEKKQSNLDYFLQKVEIRKMARGNWDREKMRNSDQKTAKKFAEDLLEAVWREVNTTCEKNIKEYFNVLTERLSHESILLLANTKVTEELDKFYQTETINEDNFVVQYICSHAQCLKRIFQDEWAMGAAELHPRIIGNMKENFTKQITALKQVLGEFQQKLIECKKSDRTEGIWLDSDSNFEVATNSAHEELGCTDSKTTRETPFKAMVLFLEKYLNPNVNPEEFNQFFSNLFQIDGIRVKKHHDTYILFEKNFHTQVLDEKIFDKLTDTNMFRSSELIFNIEVYVQEFLLTLNCYEYKVTEDEYEIVLKDTKEEFEAHVINCSYQCPSCGKFCERESHPHAGKCQVMTGHQISSMGGNVWNTNEEKTAILLMCDDYKEDSPVLIPGQKMKWWEFKEKCGDQWDWTLPKDKKFLTLQKENHSKMKSIWDKFGRGILKYYGNRGTHITYIPYTSPAEIYTSLYGIKYYICFVIDGTNMMCRGIKYVIKWVKEAMKDSLLENSSSFKVIVYHGHHSVENFPNNSEFTSDDESIENFLMNITTNGDENNEFPMLHGLATAANEIDWKLGFGIKNIIVHFNVEPTDGHFNIFTAKGKCDKGCQFDWKRDINDRIYKMKIQYKSHTLIPYTHPEYSWMRNILGINPVNDQTIGVDLNSMMDSHPKTQFFINYKTDN